MKAVISLPPCIILSRRFYISTRHLLTFLDMNILIYWSWAGGQVLIVRTVTMHFYITSPIYSIHIHIKLSSFNTQTTHTHWLVLSTLFRYRLQQVGHKNSNKMPNFQVLIIENGMGSMKNKKIIMWLISNDEYKKCILGF